MSGYYVRGGNSDWILSRRARSGVKRRKTRRRVVRAGQGAAIFGG